MTKICSENLHGFAQRFTLRKKGFHGNWRCQYLQASFPLCSLKKKANALGTFQTLLTFCDTPFLF